MITKKISGQTDLKIGTVPGTLAPSAVFEVASTNKGVLIPRVTTAQMNAISSPALGLLVFNTDANCLYFYASTWKSQCDPANLGAWSLLGNIGTNATTHFLGTTDNVGLAFRTNNTERMRITEGGNVGIGTNNPQGKLHLRGSIVLGDTIAGANYAGLPFSYPSVTSSALWFGTYNNVGTNDYGLMYGEVNGTSDNYTFNILSGDNLSDKIFVGNVDFSTSVRRGITITSGNLGVNTAAPIYKLDVDANTGSTGNPLRLQGLQAGAITDSILSSASGVVRRLAINQLGNGNFWKIGGNTEGGVRNLGTTDNFALPFITNNAERMRITEGGNVGIGTNNPSTNLEIVGMGKIQTASTFNLFLNGGTASNTGTYNTAIGINAFTNATTAEYNTAVGAGALRSTTIGAYNTAFGNSALFANTTGSSNIAFGGGALQVNTIGTHNGALGIQALQASVSGNHNLGVGNYALSSLTSGNGNIALGWGAGGNITSGSENIIIGFQVNPASLTGSNQLNIGNLIYGTNVGSGANGNIGINIGTPLYKLDINGNAGNPLRLQGLQAGATTDSILSSASGVVRRLAINQLGNGNFWKIGGNTEGGVRNLGTTDNFALPFITNNTERMRITEGGNVGIGTNNPTAKLQILGSLYLGSGLGGSQVGLPFTLSSTTSNALWIGTHNNATTSDYGVIYGSFGSFPNDNYTLNILTGDNATGVAVDDRIFLGNVEWTTNTRKGISIYNGNLGVNDTLPTYKLDIDANTGSAGNPLRLRGLQAGATTDSILTSASGIVRRLAINQLGTGNFWKIDGNTEGGIRNLGTTDNFALPFVTNNAERMRITEGGNVGIGVANPISRFQVVGGDFWLGGLSGGALSYPSTSRTLNFSADNSQNGDPTSIYNYYAGSDLTHLRISVGDNGNISNDMLQIGGAGASWYPWVSIRANGMGIGTTDPQYKLDIDANTGSSGNPLRLQGLQAGATTDSILTSASGIVRRLAINQLGNGNFWKIGGNTEGGVRNFGTTDNFALPFVTNNTERMRIAETGNIGIGITSPQYTFDINGTTLLRNGNSAGSFTNNQLVFGWAGGNTYMHAIKTRHNSGAFTNNAMDFYLWQYGTDAVNTAGTMHIMTLQANNTGVVGIGTNNPQYKLDIDANTGGTGNPLRLQGLQAGATTDSLVTSQSGILKRLAINQLGTGNFWKIGGNTEGGVRNFGTTDNFALPFVTNNAERMRITEGGSVGIGTTTPTQMLAINGGLGVLANSSVSSQGAYLHWNRGGGDGATWLLNQRGVGGGGIYFGSVTTANVATIGMTLTDAGSLGIGTTTPSAKLHVAGDVKIDGTNTLEFGAGVAGKESNAGKIGYRTFSTDALDIIGAGTNGLNRKIMFWNEGGAFFAGNIGIATPTPNAMLQFNNTITNRQIVLWETANNDHQYYGFGINNGTLRYQVSQQAANHIFYAGTSTTTSNELMRIQGNGNVGIGTASPSYRLDLGGGTFGFGANNVRTETRDNAGLQGNAGAQSGFFETATPTNYPAGASGWWHLIDTRHNNPSNNYALQIAGSFFDQELWFRKTNGDPAMAWTRLISSTNMNTYTWTRTGNSGTNTSTNFLGTTDNVGLVFRTNNAERVRITEGGNVAIGHTAPLNKLDVLGGIGLGAYAYGITDVTYQNSSAYVSFRDGDGSMSEDFIGYKDNQITFADSPGGSDVTHPDVVALGKLGISTNSVASKLTINTGTGYDGIRIRPNDGTSGSTIFIDPNANATSNTPANSLWLVQNEAADIAFGTGATMKMVLKNSGSVGIGTGVPDQLLSVNGNASKSGGGSWATFSDRRVKRNIEPFTEGVATLQKINPVRYQYNAKSGYTDTTKAFIGVIAQDVEQVAPYMVEKVKTQAFDDQRVYDATALTYILVNSVKEQQQQIETLRKENDVLKQKIQELEDVKISVESLKAMLLQQQMQITKMLEDKK